MTRLVQLKRGITRRVAVVEEPNLRLLDGCSGVYDLARVALSTNVGLVEAARQRSTAERLDYDEIYSGNSEWKLLPAIDHPEPTRCLVSGTGLTHLGSARDRQSMHAVKMEDLTDSMKMFHWGMEGGRPAPDSIGVPPEWFYKGTGAILRGHSQPLEIPPYAEDGGEEAEIAGIYLIASDGTPRRIGMAGGNEFSDHSFEKKNYLNLAASKLRTCAIGPELVVDPDFRSVSVEVNVKRDGAVLWEARFRTGEQEMCHSLQNLEHHHFKFESHRHPGDIHVHFFGTERLSFSSGVHLQDGDTMQIAFEGFGRPLCNPIKSDPSALKLIEVTPLA